MAPRALALLALPLLVAPRAVALAPTPLAPLSPLERRGADAPLAAARRAAAAELGAVAAARWDAAEYEAIARDWAFLPLWQGARGAFTEWADAMPATRRALEGALAAGLRLHPLQEFACGVARMEAGSRIAEHCDGGLLSFTCHLGLDVPDGCALTVGGEARRWRAGEFLAFDPSWPHSAENPTAADRYVLLLQPLRDDVADADVAAVAHFLDPATRPPPHAAHPSGSDGRWAAAPFFDAEASAGEPLRSGDVVAPAYVAVDDAGGVDWIAVSDADWTDVLRDPGGSWLPLEGAEGPLLDQVDEVAADAAPADKAEAAPADKAEAAPAKAKVEAKAEAAPARPASAAEAEKRR
ncbi:peptide-aspartate beta-dioxygenase [Aureococcus anophagefferens]|nr:peptide-aspartate beta-dioxygenase [Aureococcus anophagefferens]